MSSTVRKATARKKKAVEAEHRPEPSHEEIALRAYEIHESGDGADELGNWLRAEQEVSARYVEVA